MSNLNVKIGLEVHVQITSLKSKLFCSCSSEYRGKPPNTNVCPTCLGLPGALPVVNIEAVKAALMVALALKCTISDVLVFSRKHYFYPDLVKNYQISQYDGIGSVAIARNGLMTINVDGKTKPIRIRRINIEEDPGKIIYPTGSLLTSKYTLIDYNRSGIPLLEIVSEPDLTNPKEARIFIDKLRSILEHIGLVNPELEGSIRVDANISLEGGSRVEVKNISSSKDVERALTYEIIRQSKALEHGEVIRRETRHWDDLKKVTISARVKELEEDYRYFPDPDLPPFKISKELIEETASKLPELPDQRVERFMKTYGLSEYLANVLVSEKGLADYFEDCVKICGEPESIGNIIVNDLKRWIDELDLSIYEAIRLFPQKDLCQLVDLLNKNVINIKILKEIIPRALKSGKSASTIVYEEGYVDISDEDVLLKIIDEVIRENPKAVGDALTNPKAINYLVGQVMRKSKGRANPELTNKLLIKRLNELSRASSNAN
ncbi:MAG: Asp-tRNA(Asn)/Glu-tRNA(Gln) amidotransferase subunit GatB [Sulfolobales archaeon]|nr:Asp-tRNA(Asn)/Glu-tRNA(Gln) amidotransferase subunit GatB [Sulfolobales archaeon]MCX8186369.1 Asp-tRNA(Asn)/Glu-tRNA(Gln) amidotransferase subunit GatB [Sulfolobales archaeon]MDW7968896.1 Asp-tRNA(Asn)/Glu-tRNA(Gln) amidotransferase subunit GatB [Sulfolobales archaeon]